MQYFGERLRQLRQARGMTQQELAQKLNLTKASVSAYETSGKYPSVEVLRELAVLFNVSADYLLGLTDDRRIDFTSLTDEQFRLIHALIQQYAALNAMGEERNKQKHKNPGNEAE